MNIWRFSRDYSVDSFRDEPRVNMRVCITHTHTHTHTRECLVNLKKYLYSQRIEQTKDVLEYEIEM